MACTGDPVHAGSLFSEALPGMSWKDKVFDTLRTKFGSGQVRYNGHSYTCPAASSESAFEGDAFAIVEGATGALRLKTSELRKPLPETGKPIDVKNTVSGDWESYTILAITQQQAGATFRIQYGI